MKTLLIVESPAKAKTIEKLLGSDYMVTSSFGHIRELEKPDSKKGRSKEQKPKNNLGVEVENNFRPIYRIIPERSKQIKEIQEKISKVDRVLLAADDDREGESIAWHCAIVFKQDLNSLNRIAFHEITEKALKEAVANPRRVNLPMVYSQQARRILDRLVGFEVSPILWKHVKPDLSAGRVQSVCLKIIVEKEKEIEKVGKKQFFKVEAEFEMNQGKEGSSKDTSSPNIMVATLSKPFDTKEETHKFLSDSIDAVFKVKSVESKKVEKRPPPPYTTVSLQQDVGTRFSLGSKAIMTILQKLYEAGQITYHRTDSTALSTHIQEEIKKTVEEDYGKKYVHLRIYKSPSKCAQEAHEAIRPTHINVKSLTNEQFSDLDKKIYDIIWKRTVASQMTACISDVMTIIIEHSKRTDINFVAKAEKIVFDGYKRVYQEPEKEDQEDEDKVNPLFDSVKTDDLLSLNKMSGTEKVQNPPHRFSEPTIIKKMEQQGIGRPSTYASIMDTLLERKYVEKKDIKGEKFKGSLLVLEKKKISEKAIDLKFGAESKKLVPTDIGKITCDFLENHFDSIMDVNFTSKMEEKLDCIVQESETWTNVVRTCYETFHPKVVELTEASSMKENTLKKRLLGQDNSGNNIYVYVAKYGPVYQIGDTEPKYVKLEPPKTVETATIEDFKAATAFPKNLGMVEEKEVIVKNGRYGYYLTHNGKNYTIPTDKYDEHLSIEDATCIILAASNTSAAPKKGVIKVFDNMEVREGPYGPYILYNKAFYNIPKSMDANEITKEECDRLIAEQKDNKKPAARQTKKSSK